MKAILWKPLKPSIRGKTRVSHLANKEIKKMLHLAALVTIRKGNIMY